MLASLIHLMGKATFQHKFADMGITDDQIDNLHEFIEGIYQNIKNRFVSAKTFEEILTGKYIANSQAFKPAQKPEEFARRYIIEELIGYFGYEQISEGQLQVPEGYKYPDLVIHPKDDSKFIVYLEAEPLNVNLRDKNHGLGQVDVWLSSRYAESYYGIATDGFKWIIHQFNRTSKKIDEIIEVDIRNIFLKLNNPKSFVDDAEIKEILTSFMLFESTNFSKFCGKYIEIAETIKEDITKKFYTEYVRWVFGYDKNGNPLGTNNLLDSILMPNNNEKDKRLFSVIFMNRLIFIKFLEDKGLVPNNLMNNLWQEYKNSSVPASFYKTYLNPLFYDILNTEKDRRKDKLKDHNFYKEIPYLNGGLFREVVSGEKNYDIKDEGTQLIIEFLDEYEFTMGASQNINPDILGYVFEKTINYISGTGTNQQKLKGAYYTPDDVVHFIIENTIIPIIFEKMKAGLMASGWKERDVKGYESVDDVLKRPPMNPKQISKMIEFIDEIKILDPTCGSGHFLTAALSEIISVKRDLLSLNNKDIDSYNLKKEIIAKNLYGVDIDENAVEIARLRLWLSAIEEVTEPSHIDTLPNIDFNVLSGNSLIGWTNEKLTQTAFGVVLDDEVIKAIIMSLKIHYGPLMDEIEELLGEYDPKNALSNPIKAYKKLIDVYRLESGQTSVQLKQLIDIIKGGLYEVVTKAYLASIYTNSPDLDSQDAVKVLKKNLFHWYVDFDEILEDGGFDIVIGNPPYIEDRDYDSDEMKIINSESCGKFKSCTRCPERRRLRLSDVKKCPNRVPILYESMKCGNTHAYFIERSLKLLKNGGYIGFIVPLSLVSTDRMGPIRTILHKNSSKDSVFYYNFDDRPGKIFSGIEDCRSTIVITKKGTGTNLVYTSGYNRWHTTDRAELFNDIETIDWSLSTFNELIPKMKNIIEKNIYSKLLSVSCKSTINTFIVDDSHPVWYHNAPRYWIHAHTEEYVPEVVENREGVITNRITDQYKYVNLSMAHKMIVLGLLNSSLFYWWYILWSDGRHLLDQHIRDFPFDLDDFPKELKERVANLGLELMEEFEANSNKKVNQRRGGYEIIIKEIIPKKSKPTLDKIDDIFAEYYEFTNEETDYIKTFDLGFRMG